ncbi:conserved Plasmodium protein, unknown function [Plasmodium ovale wallikeri]|uniref:Uncharacterized protein n=2 Tax=Plasmodium ovale TaxID=36330 RepID=A0A1A9AMF3_PLAOA|nr:conserved Plasmodium protein, unknown function [Plasmodium ovale wallikeri]SBT57263.1 conserved Plasmodium protein, unknown function [Plasmodium ovale wallikeri]SBT74418.1 conserved Plasmodium protein, unknown function [Plasmodium ovale]
MGNSCKKVIRTKRKKSLSDEFNHRFAFRSDKDSSWNSGNYYNDIYIRKMNKDGGNEKNSENVLPMDDSNFKTNNSILYIDELYNILEHEKKVKIKKVDNSDVEEFLIIEKHIKLKRKKKKKINIFSKKKDKILKNEKFPSLLFPDNGNSINNGNNNVNNNIAGNTNQNNCNSKNNNSINFDEPFPDDSPNKKKNKMKDRSYSKNAEVETWCSSSTDNKYDIFEEDKRYLLKKRQENMKNDKDNCENNVISSKRGSQGNGGEDDGGGKEENRTDRDNKSAKTGRSGKSGKSGKSAKNNNKSNNNREGNNDNINLTCEQNNGSNFEMEKKHNNNFKRFSDPFED